MKYKKVMLATLLLLAILTIGAVSASEDVTSDDELAVGDEVADIQLAQDDFNTILSDGNSTSESGEVIINPDYGNSTGFEDDYYIYVHDDREFRTDIEYEEYDEEADVGGIILRPNTMEGRFAIFSGEKEIFSKNIIINEDGWHFDENGNLKHVVLISDLNLTGIEDGDDITFAFFDGQGNEVEYYTRHVKIQIEDNIVRFYNDDVDGDIILWLNTEDVFSTDPEDLPAVFASVTVPEGTQGNATFISNDRKLYSLALSDFMDGRIDQDDNRYNIALEVDGEFIFEGLNDGDWFKFAFLDENGDEIAGRDYHIFFGDNTVRFEVDAHNPGDHVSIDVSGEVNINDGDDFVWINLPSDVTEGKVMVTSGEFTLFEESVNFDDGTHWWREIDDHYVCSFSPDSLTNWDKLNTGDVVTFAFLDGEDQMVESKDYKVTVEDDNVRFDECQHVDVGIWDENDERGILYTDSEGNVVSVYVPRSYEGNVFRIYVNDNEAVNWEAEFDGDNEWEYKDWGIEELGITEAGNYNIAVVSDNGEDNEILLNTTITVSEFEEDDFRAMILYAREVIKFYAPANAEGTIRITTQKETRDDDYEQIFDESYEITDEYRGNWTEFALEDLGFEADGAFRIFTLTVTNTTDDEVYRYRVSHVDGENEEPGDWYMEKIEFAFNTMNDDGDMEFNKTSDVLVAWLYIPDVTSKVYNEDTGEYEDYKEYEDVSATVYVSLNGELIKTIKTTNFTELVRPNHYPIILDLSDLKDKDMLTFRVEAIHENTNESAIDEEENEWLVAVEDKGDYVSFHDDVDFERLEFSVFCGNLTLGTTNDPDLMGVIKYNLVIITISDSLGINEGTVTVSDGKTTIFTRQLSECVKEYDYGSAGYGYYISLDDVKDIIPEGKNLTVSFNYADNTLFEKRIRFEDYLYTMVTVEDIDKQYRFEIPDDVMIHENDTAIHLYSDTNRQAIFFDLGGGYFTVYVNGVKVENLGRISYNTWKDNANWREDDFEFVTNYLPDEEAFLNYVASYWGSDLELFRLTSWTQGAPEIEITLADLGINESGTYNIRITHYPSVPGGLDDHSSLGYESMYADEMLIPTVTEVLDVNITCNFDPDYAKATIYPVTIYRNGIPFLFTFEFGDNILSESNNVLIYVDGELAFESPVLYYAENDEGEMELEDLWIVGPEMLNEALFDEYGLLDVGEYEAVVYLVKGDDAPVEIGRGNFSRIKQRGDMSFTIGSSDDDDGMHTIIYADIPEGDWTDYTLEISIADSEGVYPEDDDNWVWWFNEYVIFKDNQIYFKDSLKDLIGKGPVPIDLGVLENGTRIFVALEHGEETVFGDWDFYHSYFTVTGENPSEITISNDIVFDYNESGSANITLVGASDITANVVGHDEANVTFDNGIITVSGLDAGSYTLNITTVPEEGYGAVTKLVNITVNKMDSNLTVDVSDVNVGNQTTITIRITGTGNVAVRVGENTYMVTTQYGVGYLQIYLNAGNYDVNARFEGDNNINPSEANATFTVNKLAPTIVITPGEAVEGSDLAVDVTVDDATGNVTVNGKAMALADGKATAVIENVAAGELAIEVNYSGDEKYLAAANSTKVNVKAKMDADLIVSVDDIYVGESATVNVEINANVTGKVTVDGKEVEIVDGKATVAMANLTAGEHTVVAVFEGDRYFNPASANATFTVNKLAPTIVITPGEAIEGSDLTVDVTVADATGNVTVNGKTVALTGGKATAVIENVVAGELTIEVNYMGDDKYAAASNSTKVNVQSKKDAELTSNNVTIAFGDAGVIDISIAKDATGKLTVNGEEVTVTDGAAKFEIKDLAAGTYKYDVKFAGDKYFNAAELTVDVVVNKVDSTLTVGDIVFDYGSSGVVSVAYTGATNITAQIDAGKISIAGNMIVVSGLDVGSYILTVTTVPDANHNAVTKTVNVTVNKVDSSLTVNDVASDYGSQIVTTVSTVGATGITAVCNGADPTVIDNVIVIEGLDAGSYILTVTTVPDANHNAVTKTANVTVNKVDSTVVVEDISFNYGASGSTAVALTGADNFTATVDSDKAVVTIEGNVITVSGLDAGSYTLSVTTVPDANHNAVTRTATVTVNKVKSTITLSDDVEFDYGASASVDASFTGATGITAKVVNNTDAVIGINGSVVTVSVLDAGNYILEVTTTPDSNHYASTASVNVTVKALSTKVTASKVSTTYGTSKNIVVTLKDANGNILANKNVTVKLNNKVYTKTTNANGKISVSVPKTLAAGKTYTATLTFDGDNNYAKSTGSVKVAVSKAASKLTAKDKTFKKSVKTKKYTVTVKTDKNKALKNGKVTIKVNKVTYTAYTNSKGQATLKITKLNKKGKYTANVKFAGNKNYKAKSRTVKITVK